MPLPASTVDFNIEFDCGSVPVCNLIDTSDYTGYPTSTLYGKFVMTSPDGIKDTVEGFLNTFESGGVITLPVTLRLAANSQPMTGAYQFSYTVTESSVPQELVKNHTLNYFPVSPVLTKDFDECEPYLKYKDDTSYSVTNFTHVLTRSLTATNNFLSQDVTTSSQIIDMKYGGNYYYSSHTIVLSSSLVYTSTTSSWFTLKDLITKTVTVSPEVPPAVDTILGYFKEYVDLIESVKGINLTKYELYKKEYAYAISLWTHAVYSTSAIDNVAEYIRLVIAVLKARGFITYTPDNSVLEPYDFSSIINTGGVSFTVLNSDDYSNTNILLKFTQAGIDYHVPVVLKND